MSETDLKTYKIIETRLYGELMKTCRRYSNELNLISILGIVEMVKQEMTELDKTNRAFTKTQPAEQGSTDDEKNQYETIR